MALIEAPRSLPWPGPRALGALLLMLTASCDRSLTRDVHDDAKLTARVQEVVRPGSDSAAARRVLAVQGFQCSVHSGSAMDTLEKNLDGAPDRLSCEKQEQAQQSAKSRITGYHVDVLLEGPTVRGVEAHLLTNPPR